MYTGKQFNENIKQIGFLIVILLLAFLIVDGLKYFASSILGGFTLYMILRKPLRYLLNKGWKNTIATTTLLLISFAVISLIAGSLLTLVYSKLRHFSPQEIGRAHV